MSLKELSTMFSFDFMSSPKLNPFLTEKKRTYTALQALTASQSKPEAIKYLVERAGYSIHARDTLHHRNILYPLLYYLAEELAYSPDIFENSLSQKYTSAEKDIKKSQSKYTLWKQNARIEQNALQEKLKNYKKDFYYPITRAYALPKTAEKVQSSAIPFQEAKKYIADIENQKKTLETQEKQYQNKIKENETAFLGIQEAYYDCFKFLKELIDNHGIEIDITDADGNSPFDILEKEIPTKFLESKTVQLNAYLRNIPQKFVEKYNQKIKQSSHMSQVDYAWYLLRSDSAVTKKALIDIVSFLSQIERTETTARANIELGKNEILDDTLHIVMQESTLINAVKALVRNGHDPNEQNRSGATVLHNIVVAAEDKTLIKIAYYLVKQKKVDVNIQDQAGNLPLHLSVGKVITQCLLEADTDYKRINNQGYTALEMAYIKKDFEKVHCLLDYIESDQLSLKLKNKILDLVLDNVEESFFAFSSHFGSYNIHPSFFAQRVAIANLPYLLTHPIYTLPAILLEFLVQSSPSGLIDQNFLKQHAASFVEASLQKTFDQWRQEHILIKRLLANGVRGSHKLTLHYAMRCLTSHDIQAWITRTCIQPSEFIDLDKYGNTALHFACDEAMTSFLLDKGVRFIRNHTGSTPLHYACARGDLEVVHCFLKRASSLQFDINTVDQYGCSGLDLTLKVSELLTWALSIMPKDNQVIRTALKEKLKNCNDIKQLLVQNRACIVECALEGQPSSDSEVFEEASPNDSFLVVDYRI